MPTFLADPPQAVIVLLVAGLLVTGLIWMNRRGRKVAIAFLVLLVLTCLSSWLIGCLRARGKRPFAAFRRWWPRPIIMTPTPSSHMSRIVSSTRAKGESPAKFTRRSATRHPFWPMLRQFNVHVAVWDF